MTVNVGFLTGDGGWNGGVLELRSTRSRGSYQPRAPSRVMFNASIVEACHVGHVVHWAYLLMSI